MNPQPLTLTGLHARLEPLCLAHAEGLLAIGRDESIWTHMTRGWLVDLNDARGYIATALKEQDKGTQLAFAIIQIGASGADGVNPAAGSDRIAGTTRYLNISLPDRGLEIGWTWLGVEFQRTAINTECKYMLLKHAFETLGCVRVQLKTDARNMRSRAAIERIGGVKEGVLRKFQLTQNGRIRDTAMFSIIDEEWPAAKARLEDMLGNRGEL